jgi:hypothetical protein
MLGLNYFHVLGGQIYSFEAIAGWLADTGFTQVQRMNVLRAPGNNLIIATKER